MSSSVMDDNDREMSCNYESPSSSKSTYSVAPRSCSICGESTNCCHYGGINTIR